MKQNHIQCIFLQMNFRPSESRHKNSTWQPQMAIPFRETIHPCAFAIISVTKCTMWNAVFNGFNELIYDTDIYLYHLRFTLWMEPINEWQPIYKCTHLPWILNGNINIFWDCTFLQIPLMTICNLYNGSRLWRISLLYSLHLLSLHWFSVQGATKRVILFYTHWWPRTLITQIADN